MTELEHTKTRLKKRWDDPVYVHPALRSITFSGAGLRVLRGVEVEFRYPVTVLAGENGTGKSTILAAAACAYHADLKTKYAPYGLPRLYYTFGDFLISTKLDEPLLGCEVKWRYSGDGYPEVHWARRVKKWTDYATRPGRAVQFIGISRALPVRERTVLRSHFARGGDLKGRTHSEEERQVINRVLAARYTMTARAVSGVHAIHVARGSVTCSSFNMGAGEDSTFDLVEVISAVPQGALVLIEEVETGLHPAAQKRIMNEILFASWKKHLQFILTTHSGTVLESVPKVGRVFLSRVEGRIWPQYGVTSTYALSAMSDERIPEIIIYVEDRVAEAILQAVLINEIRSRTRIQPIGGWESIASQLVAHRRNPRLTAAMVVLDGDVSRDEFFKCVRRHLGRNLTSGDTTWFDSHLARLPGETPPEDWIVRSWEVDAVRQAIASSLGCNLADLEEILDRVSLADPHEVFEHVSGKTGLKEDVVRWVLCSAAVGGTRDEFRAVEEKVLHMLETCDKALEL